MQLTEVSSVQRGSSSRVPFKVSLRHEKVSEGFGFVWIEGQSGKEQKGKGAANGR